MTSSFVPEMTSAEALEMYPAGLKIAGGEGDAWRDVRLSIFSLDTQTEQFPMPAAAAVPYEFSWRRISSEPFQVMLITFSLPLLERALTDVYGQKANTADLRDVSGFQDAVLVSLLACLRQEVKRPQASALYVQGIAQAIAVHLARYYAIFSEVKRDDASTLPRYILKKIIAWMTDHLADEFSLARLAQQAHMSEFHFNRLFKRSVGVPPSRYQIKLRLDAARRLLRETDLTIIEIANRVGYSNPSHFAQLFRKENGLSPSAYRRQP